MKKIGLFSMLFAIITLFTVSSCNSKTELKTTDNKQIKKPIKYDLTILGNTDIVRKKRVTFVLDGSETNVSYQLRLGYENPKILDEKVGTGDTLIFSILVDKPKRGTSATLLYHIIAIDEHGEREEMNNAINFWLYNVPKHKHFVGINNGKTVDIHIESKKGCKYELYYEGEPVPNSIKDGLGYDLVWSNMPIKPYTMKISYKEESIEQN